MRFLSFYGFFFVGLIFLACFLQAQNQPQPQDTVIIEVGGYVWNRTTLRTLIVTSENQSWWSESLVNSTLRAIEDWNHAITFFAENYSGFGYLSAVNLQTQVSSDMLPYFDIYINFSDSVAITSEDAIGLTTTVPYSNGTIQKCLITLATQSQYVSLTEKDIQSVATHELGHALGIGHSNSSSNLMYPMFDVYAAQYEISTLDMYGVATAFQWIIHPDLTVPTAKQELTLPADINYTYIPAVEPAPETITDNPVARALEIIGRTLLNPYILLMIVIGVSVLIGIELFFRRDRQAKNRKNPKR
jgi:hypothetical protein